MLVAKGDRVDDYTAEDLRKITDGKAKAKPLRLRHANKTWTAEAAA